jgi:hypothetical protein
VPLKSIIKGWVGEVQGAIAKKMFMDAEIYADINNVTIPTASAVPAESPGTSRHWITHDI